MKLSFSILLLIIAFFSESNGQSVNVFERSTFHVTRDTFNKFPDTLSIEGDVVVPGGRTYCGVVCIGSWMLIKLKGSHPSYPYDLLYLAYGCDGDAIYKQLRSNVKLKVAKIGIKDNSCFWNFPVSYDSKGLPFYKFDENWFNYFVRLPAVRRKMSKINKKIYPQ